MDIQRLLAAAFHESATIDQASKYCLDIAEVEQKCARVGCDNWFEPHANQKYCRGPECLWERGLVASREKNARRKARRGAA